MRLRAESSWNLGFSLFCCIAAIAEVGRSCCRRKASLHGQTATCALISSCIKTEPLSYIMNLWGSARSLARRKLFWAKRRRLWTWWRRGWTMPERSRCSARCPSSIPESKILLRTRWPPVLFRGKPAQCTFVMCSWRSLYWVMCSFFLCRRGSAKKQEQEGLRNIAFG